MPERPADLADFENPPVAEVLLGLQFRTEKPIGAPHVGLYWSLIREDFPEFQEVPPLPGWVEDLTKPPYPESQQISLAFGGTPPLPRYWFLGDSQTKLIQVQRDWFLHNWREVSGAEKYPHFEGIRNEFLNRWSQFVLFCTGNSLGVPRVTLAEVTYVNHILKGTCWEEMQDLPAVLSFLGDVKDDRLRNSLEAVSSSLSFRLPRHNCRLYVNTVPAIRSRDKQLMVRMNLTVRGPIQTEPECNLLEWFNNGRWWIVKGFELLTTKKAHDFWKRIR